MDRPAIARDLWDRVLSRVDEIDDWTRPTPSEGWDIKDVVAHLSGAQRFFDEGENLPQPPASWEPPPGTDPLDAWTQRAVAARRDWSPEQLTDELRAAAAGHIARVEETSDWTATTKGPTGETTAGGLFATRVFDLWVHLQDLALALGRPADAPDSSGAAELVARYVFDLVPWLYATKVQAGEGSPLRLRLGAPLDRDQVVTVTEGRAGWAEDTDAGVAHVTGDAAAFALLACGRGSPAHWRDAGLLEWGGKRGQEWVERARLEFV